MGYSKCPFCDFNCSKQFCNIHAASNSDPAEKLTLNTHEKLNQWGCNRLFV